MELFYFIAGFVLGLIYSAGTMPATVWVVQVTFVRGFITGEKTSLALSLGQFVWVLFIAQALLNSKEPFVFLDPFFRLLYPFFFFWMAYAIRRSARLESLLHQVEAEPTFFSTFKSSLLMPWRIPIWIGLFISISIHLKAPGSTIAILCAGGAFVGIFLWNTYFVLLTKFFGSKVPESITVRSLNKLRILSFAVFMGLGILIAAPLMTYIE